MPNAMKRLAKRTVNSPAQWGVCAAVMDSPLGMLTLYGNGKALTAIRISDKPLAKNQL